MNTILHNFGITVGDNIDVELIGINELKSDTTEKIRELIEQDILFSNIENISRVLVIEKGKEDFSFYENEASQGVSYFHIVDGLYLHVRIS